MQRYISQTDTHS